jgi:hypothetical protein
MGEVLGLEKELKAGIASYVRSMMPDAERAVAEGLIQMAFSASDSMRKGDAVLVTTETMQLVDFASQSLVEEDERLFYDVDLAPLQRAVLFFEQPLPVTITAGYRDLRSNYDGKIVCDAMMFWDSRSDYPDESDPVQVYVCYLRAIESPRLSMAIDESFLTILWMTGTTEVMERYTPENYAPSSSDDVGALSRADLHSFLQSFWTLMRQPIISEQRVRPIEPTARKHRKKLTNRGEVRMLHLRQHVRPTGASAAGSAAERHFEYSHRFIVRGFWRNQRCGVGGKERKRIWVDSYVKGPADKPLVVGKRVYKE